MPKIDFTVGLKSNKDIEKLGEISRYIKSNSGEVLTLMKGPKPSEALTFEEATIFSYIRPPMENATFEIKLPINAPATGNWILDSYFNWMKKLITFIEDLGLKVPRFNFNMEEE